MLSRAARPREPDAAAIVSPPAKNLHPHDAPAKLLPVSCCDGRLIDLVILRISRMFRIESGEQIVGVDLKGIGVVLYRKGEQLWQGPSSTLAWRAGWRLTGAGRVGGTEGRQFQDGSPSCIFVE